jgi:hypothetical protein
LQCAGQANGDGKVYQSAPRMAGRQMGSKTIYGIRSPFEKHHLLVSGIFPFYGK